MSFPVLASNLDLNLEPTLAATHLAKSKVLTVAGKKIGVIGYLTTETKVCFVFMLSEPCFVCFQFCSGHMMLVHIEVPIFCTMYSRDVI